MEETGPESASSSQPPRKIQCQQYQCEVCGKYYGQRKSLLRHPCIGGQRKWTCRLCGDSFSRSDVRRRHENERHGNKKRIENSKWSAPTIYTTASQDAAFDVSQLETMHVAPSSQLHENNAEQKESPQALVSDSQATTIKDFSEWRFNTTRNNNTELTSQQSLSSLSWERAPLNAAEYDTSDDLALQLEWSLQNDSGIDLQFDGKASADQFKAGSRHSEADIDHTEALYTPYCYLCGLSFGGDLLQSLDHLKSHFRDFGGRFTCDVCRVAFRCEAQLFNHLQSAASGFCGYKFEHKAKCGGHHGFVECSYGIFPDVDRMSLCDAIRISEQDTLDQLARTFCNTRSAIDSDATTQYHELCAKLGQSLAIPITISCKEHTSPWSGLQTETCLSSLSDIEWKKSASASILLQARRPVEAMSPSQTKKALLFAAAEGNLPRLDSMLHQSVSLDIRSHRSDEIGMVFVGATPLALAAFHGHLEAVKLLLRNNADPNFVCSDQNTALHLASSRGHQDIVSELLRNGASVFGEDGFGQTALQMAIFEHYAVAEVLLEHGASIYVKTKTGCQLLEESVRNKDSRASRLLLRYGADPNLFVPCTRTLMDAEHHYLQRDSEWLSYIDASLFENKPASLVPILHLALKEESLNVAEVLLSFGASVGTDLPEGISMLQAAVDSGSFSAAKLLLNYGAEMNAGAEGQTSVIHQAFQRSSWSAVIFLLSHLAETDQHAATTTSPMTQVKLYLPPTSDALASDGAQVSWLDMESQSQSASVTIGDSTLVLRLLICGAVLDKRGGDLQVALCYASAEGETETAKTLISRRGADVNASGGPFGNALCYAAAFGRMKLLQMLIANGGDVHHIGGTYGNALNTVAGSTIELCNRAEVAIALLDLGANVNLPNSTAGTALYQAASRGRPELVHLLLSRGADVNQVGGKFGTPLCAAATKGYIDIVKILLSHGANADMQCITGVTLCRVYNSSPSTQSSNRMITWTQYFDTIRNLQPHCSPSPSRYDIILRLINREYHQDPHLYKSVSYRPEA